jgi:DNA repair photolyase
MTYKLYKPKTILNTHKHCDGGWFWVKYSAFPYVGCEWGCEYCYWRDEKYNPHKPSRDIDVLKFEDAFSQYIKVKEAAPELLRKALKNKPIDLIYLDNYQPIEAKYQYCRKMLEVCLELGFPVFINEKSPMLLRDIDILKKISKKSYLNVSWSIITTKDDKTHLIFEPKAPPVQARFEAMQQLARGGILTGTVFMPILPFIYDDEKNIEAVVKKTKECGGQYVLDAGLTLWGYCGIHFYKALEKYKPNLVAKYKKLYESPKLLSEHEARIHQFVLKCCQKYKLTSYIHRPLSFCPKELHLNKKIAEKFYLEARELQMSGQSGYKEWAYRKGAWALDDLGQDIQKIYQNKGLSGIIETKGIGKSLADKIEKILRTKKQNIKSV